MKNRVVKIPVTSNDQPLRHSESTSSIRHPSRGVSIPWHGMGTAAYRCISRYYNERLNVYHWHVAVKRNGKLYQKNFSDKHCGGEQAAFELALAWRDHMLATHPRISMAAYCSIPRSNNKTGMTGISRRDQLSRKKNGTVYHELSWNAAIPLGDRKTVYRSFSVWRYGEEGAKQRAIAARLEGLEALKKITLRENDQPTLLNSPKKFAQLEARLIRAQERRERDAAALLEQRTQQVAAAKAQRAQKAAAVLQRRQARAVAAAEAERADAEKRAARQLRRAAAAQAKRDQAERRVMQQWALAQAAEGNFPAISPNYLFDTLIRKLKLKNDAALVRMLEVQHGVISMARRHQLALRPALLRQIHEATGFSIRTLKKWLACPTGDE